VGEKKTIIIDSRDAQDRLQETSSSLGFRSLGKACKETKGRTRWIDWYTGIICNGAYNVHAMPGSEGARELFKSAAKGSRELSGRGNAA
jgi:hypothetical protein